jgi:hypothetical protein
MATISQGDTMDHRKSQMGRNLLQLVTMGFATCQDFLTTNWGFRAVHWIASQDYSFFSRWTTACSTITCSNDNPVGQIPSGTERRKRESTRLMDRPRWNLNDCGSQNEQSSEVTMPFGCKSRSTRLLPCWIVVSLCIIHWYLIGRAYPDPPEASLTNSLVAPTHAKIIRASNKAKYSMPLKRKIQVDNDISADFPVVNGLPICSTYLWANLWARGVAPCILLIVNILQHVRQKIKSS